MTPLSHAHSSIHRVEYRSEMERIGMKIASVVRESGSTAFMRDKGFPSWCPVAVKDEIADILRLPRSSFWTPDEIGQVIATSGGRSLALFIWDTYVSSADWCHTYLPDGTLLQSKLKRFRSNITNDSMSTGIQNAFTLISSTWYVKKSMYGK